jgi:hypothetical protein
VTRSEREARLTALLERAEQVPDLAAEAKALREPTSGICPGCLTFRALGLISRAVRQGEELVETGARGGG